MGLTNVAGVFSRYFIIGFYLPAFFVLVGLAQTLHSAFLPPVYTHAQSGTQILILGATALPFGLLLLGLHYHVIRLYEGYPLKAHSSTWGIRRLYSALLGVQRWKFERAVRLCRDPKSTDAERTTAKWKLDRRFPHDLEDCHQGESSEVKSEAIEGGDQLLMPTSIGNVIRAFEHHSFVRWHLNSIAVWPHIENLLSAQEAQVLADARGDVALFINTSLLALICLPLLLADRLAHDPGLALLECFVPIAIAGLAYAASVGAAVRWGEVVRASVDLHRLSLFKQFGLRIPHSFKDGRMIAWYVNDLLLVGTHVPDEYASHPECADHPEDGNDPEGADHSAAGG